MPSAGRIIQACSIFAWKPSPTQAPAQMSDRSRASVTARW